MFKTYIDTTPNANEPDPVVLVVSDFVAARDHLASAMADTLALRLDVEENFIHLGARPLMIKMDKGQPYSERAIWSLLVEHSAAAATVCAYVDQCIQACRGDLRFCTEVDVVAQEAIYAYLDRYVRRQVGHVKCIPKDTLTVLDAFDRFLNACDMDHEVHQDDYIGVVIDYLWSNPDRRADFVAFRLLNGQHAEIQSPSSPIYRVLRRKGQLRLIVEKVLTQPDIEWRLPELILELCALTYGSDERPAEDVLKYCREKVRFDERALLGGEVRQLGRMRRSGDDSPRVSTGFHTYSSSGKWEWDETGDV